MGLGLFLWDSRSHGLEEDGAKQNGVVLGPRISAVSGVIKVGKWDLVVSWGDVDHGNSHEASSRSRKTVWIKRVLNRITKKNREKKNQQGGEKVKSTKGASRPFSGTGFSPRGKGPHKQPS